MLNLKMDSTIKGFSPVSISLEEMMDAREKRAMHIDSLIGKGTVVCMTMNFIGEYKVLPFSRSIFNTYFCLLKRLISAVYSEYFYADTGDTAFFVTDMEAKKVKALCEKAEDAGEVGRLFDIDVFGSDGEKLSRSEKRKCLICSKPAAECARSRAHGVETVREHTRKVLSDFYAKDICTMAEDALCDEVSATPKPGLVDRNNSGANPDMTYEMFMKSAEAISPFMGRLFAAAGCFSHIDAEMTDVLRRIGTEAEQAMYAVTGGINTHKGAIYSLGLLCAGAGFVLSYGGSFTDITKAAAQMALELSYDITDEHTHGLDACRKYGVTGARGEAIGGFKTVLYAFERIKHYCDDRGLDTNTAYPLAICDIMAVMNDTNVLHRGGKGGLDYLHKEAGEISKMRENQRIDDLLELDEELIKRNISPGGCADALCCAIFLLKVEKLFTVMPTE